MKLKRTIAFVSALCLVAAMAFPVAAIDPVDSIGTVEFGDKGTTPPVNPEEPEKPQVPPEQPGTGQTGNLTLDVIPNFEFGRTPIPTIDTIINSKYVAGQTTKDKAVPGAQSFLQVSDARTVSSGWNVKVVASAFKNGSDEIAGAELVIDAGSVAGPDDANAPQSEAASLTCTDTTEDQITEKILWANAYKGLGTWVSRMYPTPCNENNQIGGDNKTVRLLIPGDSGVKRMAYTCNLTWTLEATP